MKTAEEWLHKCPKGEDSLDKIINEPTVIWIQAIQDDARHAALTEVRNLPFETSLRRPMETESEFIHRNLNMFRKKVQALRDNPKKEK